MNQAYHNPMPADDEDDPRRCFHRVEEVVPGGYIVEGFKIDEDDVVEVVKLDANGAPLPECRPARDMKAAKNSERKSDA